MCPDHMIHVLALGAGLSASVTSHLDGLPVLLHGEHEAPLTKEQACIDVTWPP